MINYDEQKLDTIAYTIVIITAFIYLYVTINENKLSKGEFNKLVKFARTLSFITALYFLINALIGLEYEKNDGQYKQVTASILIVLAALTRLSIKDDSIEFR